MENERARNRFLLCRRELAKAKEAIRFWSEALRLVTEELTLTDQGCFEYFDKVINGGSDEVSQEVVA